MNNIRERARGWLRRARAGLAGITAAALLVACGGGGGGGEGGGTDGGGGIAGADYYPLEAGAVWRYAGTGSGTYTTRALGSQVEAGRTVYAIEDTSSGGTQNSRYERTSTGVYELPEPSADDFERALVSIPVLPQPLLAGRSSVPLDRSGVALSDVDGDGRPEQARLRAEQTVVGFETVSTAAGTFANSAHVRTLLTESITPSGGSAAFTVTVTLDTWFAPDVGLVKAITAAQAGTRTQTDTTELQAYRVGARGTDTTPPTVAARTPAVAAAVTGAAVQVVFSEAMDRRADAGTLISVSGPSGALAGSARWDDDRTLSFAPSGLAPSGVYTVTLAEGVQDLLDNRVAGSRSWTFTIDREPPVAVAVSPADGSVEVALDAVLQIEFLEPVNPATVSAATVFLSSPQSRVPVAVTVSGTRVTIVPTGPLQRATWYTLEIGGVQDLLGNGWPGSIVGRFRTDSGRFLPPVALPGDLTLVSRAVAADLDGDARADLLVLGGRGFPVVTGLFLFRQLADGSMAEPQALPVQSSCGVAEGLAADTNGDGRADLVVSTICGIEVRLREAGAVWQPAAFLPLPFGAMQTHVWRSSGLPGIVTLPLDPLASSSASKVRLWPQVSPGVFGAAVDITPQLASMYDLRVGDVNGDGLDDLALWGVLGNDQGYGVEIRLQRSDGSFDAGRIVAVPGCGGDHDLAIGDVDGDGRADLVLVTWTCSAQSRIAVLQQAADGSFGTATLLPAESNLREVTLADINGDGRLDVVTHHSSLGVGAFLQRADGSLGAQTLYANPDDGFVLEVADFTGDGRPDVATSSGVMRQKATAPEAAAVRPSMRGVAAGSRAALGLGLGLGR